MRVKYFFAAMVLFSFSCAYEASGEASIGSISARGYVHVDGYAVLGNATLFNGTAVETGPASAILRLNNGTEIDLSVNSSGVVHNDRFVLTQGECQLKASNSSFAVEAADLRVISGGSKSIGMISLNPPSTANFSEDRQGRNAQDPKDATLVVSAMVGEFQVLNDTGLSVAQVGQGTATSLVSRGKTISMLSKAPPGPPINPGPPPPQPPLLPPASR